ncbi:hypothetical protein F4859DRAFT_517387 [Xylaria cf. heliscus]|nr:hypothetical protein F4859DRAFT_517387 [Xylaria cf. heliscus]
MLSTLRRCLIDRYTETEELADFEDAIDILKSTIHLDANNDKTQSKTCYTISTCLERTYEITQRLGSLEEAITFFKRGMELDHENKGWFSAQLASLLGKKYRRTRARLNDLFLRTGTIAHLEEAILVQRAAVVRVENDDPERRRYLDLLAHSLYRRYSEIEVESDLEEAIPTAVRVGLLPLTAAPTDHPDRPRVLEELSHRLGDLHSLTGGIEELQKAIDYATEAVDITSGGLGHAEALNTLGLRLAARYKKTGEQADVDEAVLSETYCSVSSRQMSHLNEAIQASEEAIDATPDDHPDFGEVMGTLGTVLEERHSRTRAGPDLQRAILCHQSALQQANAQVRTRIEAGIDVLRCCALVPDWQKAYEAVRVVADLVPTLSSRSLKNSDKQHVLSWAAGLASDAAATALNAGKGPYAALDLLEQGRGLLATSLEEMRADILSLCEKHRDLAEEFVRLQGELNLQASRDETTLSRSHSRPGARMPLRISTSKPYQTDKEFDQVPVNIRSRPRFETFLLPPSREEMMQAALNGGPIIVVNVSKYRSDAILVERDQIRAVALPRLCSRDVENKTLSGEIGAPHTLVWLWDVLAKPVLEALGYTSRPSRGWPQVWWIPIGPLSRFPLHAAGRHEQGPGQAVIDRVMSSYNSSIKALIRGRQQPLRSELTPSIPPRALLVAMPNTPGHAPLRFANAGVEVLRDICKAIPADFVDPGQLRGDIVGQLPGCSIFHFAGHGSTNSADPSQSHLVAYDGNITVAALLEMNLREHSPFLAYLSACGTGRVRDDAFLDESIHLISACQLAGFRHVIGTLWEVKDKLCTEMAKRTYEGIRDRGMTDDSVCLGLHNAARELPNRWLMGEMEENYREDQGVPATSNACQITVRDEGQSKFPRDILPVEVKHPAWIPYVHFGV